MRNELVLTRDPAENSDAHLRGTPDKGRFFHVSVKNCHSRKTATNCYVYLEKAVRVNPRMEIPLNSVEFKWEGYVLPNAHISARSARRFDAFWIHHDHPNHLQFNFFSDSTAFIPQIQGEGEFDLRYCVVSDNFPISRIDLRLKLSHSLDSTTLQQVGYATAT